MTSASWEQWGNGKWDLKKLGTEIEEIEIDIRPQFTWCHTRSIASNGCIEPPRFGVSCPILILQLRKVTIPQQEICVFNSSPASPHL